MDDLDEVADEVKQSLEIFPVKKVRDVLEKLDLHPQPSSGAPSDRKAKKSGGSSAKKKESLPADPFGNLESFWGRNGIAVPPLKPVDMPHPQA